jgi:hypothetical protein
MSNEKQWLTKERKYDLNEFMSKLPLQEAQRKGITKLVQIMIEVSERKMENKMDALIEKRNEKMWKIYGGVMAAVIAGVILYLVLPAKG